MTMKRLIAAVLTVVAVLLLFSGCSFRRDDPSDPTDPVRTDGSTQLPSSETDPITVTEPSPATEPTPVTEPSPVTEPLPVTEPASNVTEETGPGNPPAYVSSGELVSDTGSNMNIHALWSAVPAEDGSIVLTVEVQLSCYSIYKGAGTCYLRVGDTDASFSTPALHLDDNIVNGKIRRNSALLGTAEFVLPSPGSYAFSLSWSFRGYYGNVWVDSVTIQDTIHIAAEG